jgi:hypothetical protein
MHCCPFSDVAILCKETEIAQLLIDNGGLTFRQIMEIAATRIQTLYRNQCYKIHEFITLPKLLTSYYTIYHQMELCTYVCYIDFLGFGELLVIFAKLHYAVKKATITFLIIFITL